MFSKNVLQTNLWKQGFESEQAIEYAPETEKLKAALATMRENVSQVVAGIHYELNGLTVHDASHLDALWEVADVIKGDDFILNPLETFVFGAAVLMHDAGMTVAAFEGGIDGVRKTVEWEDAVAGELSRERVSTYQELSEDAKRRVLFSVLRLLHAKQAERLIFLPFKKPGSKREIYLLEPSELLESLGESIGRIAHSHHWNADDLPDRLNTCVGGVPGYPKEWTVNEVKVALLLRCADAAHLDSRRAPTLLYAILKPSGVSDQHWRFQNKMRQVTREGDRLIFSSGSAFSFEDASAWWLAYETIRMVDSEIKAANAILSEGRDNEFAAKSVAGGENPRILAKYVRVKDWVPVNAEVHVSDPVHLARTVGGQSLYGATPIAPLRELIQNSTDAIRARRALEMRSNGFGKINVIIEELDGTHWLHIDDNGVGMSERVLTGSLIDFGNSFWQSAISSEEFPGLASRHPELVGKYGIGFFSIFMLGDHVRVSSQKYTDGRDSARVLTFDKLTRRPTIRNATESDLPRDWSTRISVELHPKALQQILAENPPASRYGSRFNAFFSNLRNLVTPLDVDFSYQSPKSKHSFDHRWNWDEVDAEKFLDELLAAVPNRTTLVKKYSDYVRLLKKDGHIFGRACMRVEHEYHSTGFINVNGFVSLESDSGRDVIGVFAGQTNDLSRRGAQVAVPSEVLAAWATEQAGLISPKVLPIEQAMRKAHNVLGFGGDPGTLPFAFLGGEFVTYEQFKERVARLDEIHLPVDFGRYDTTPRVYQAARIPTDMFVGQVSPSVCVYAAHGSELAMADSDEVRQFINSGGGDVPQNWVESLNKPDSLKPFIDILQSLWKVDVSYRFGMSQIFDSPFMEARGQHLALTISQGSTGPDSQPVTK